VRIGAAFVKKQLSREVDAHRRSDEAYLRMKSKSLAAALNVSFMRVVFIGLLTSLQPERERALKNSHLYL
jgi:hypothetical protein